MTQPEEGNVPVLDDVLTKAPEELSEQELNFLKENEANLDDEQKQLFGLDKIKAKQEERKEEVTPKSRYEEDEEEDDEDGDKKKSKSKDSEDEEEDDEFDEDSMTTNEIKMAKQIKRLEKALDKTLSGNEKKMSRADRETKEMRDRLEVREFVTENPNLKDLAPIAMKFLKHPAYSNVPVDFIFKALDYDNAMKRGAEVDRKATEANKQTKNNGNSAPAVNNSGKKTASQIASMSFAEFADYKRQQGI